MLQRIRAIFSAGVILAGALWFLPAGSVSAASTAYEFSLVPPAPAFDFSTLDARDEFNRPVRSPVVRRSLENLFVHSFNRMLIHGLTPLRRQRDAILSVAWKCHETIRRVLGRAVSLARALAPDGSRRNWKPASRLLRRFAAILSDAVLPAHLCQAVFQSVLIASTRLQR